MYSSLYIVAGPNGAGKTTFTGEFLPNYVECLEFANADLIASGLSPFLPERAAIKAGSLMLERIHFLADRGTGIPKILRAMKANGSPAPRFKTDDNRTYFVSYFPAHPLAVSKETAQVGTKPVPSWDQVTAQVTAQVLNFCQEPRKSSEIMELIGLKHWKTFRQTI
jgi:hypothetical protein